MRGHEALIAMRRRGIRPNSSAWIDLDLDGLRCWSDWQDLGDGPHIEVNPRDSIALLDLRCLVGMDAVISGFDAERVEAMHRACIDAGCKRVISYVHRKVRGDDIEAVRVFDTAVVEH